MSKLIIVLPLFLGIFLLGNQCAPGAEHEAHEQHLMDKIKAHQDLLTYKLTEENYLDTTLFLKVHASLPNVKPFFTEKRTHKLISFPCSNCHNQPLDKMQADRNPDTRKAHWDIHLVHANEEIMDCTSCHAKEKMNKLVTLTGQLIDIDESFKLCGQCHSTQLKDWEGGAHGKQLNGWIPPRVATTCVSCHNPHQPAFPSRFPARLNTNTLGE